MSEVLHGIKTIATTDNRAQGNNNDVHKFVANVSFACSSRFGQFDRELWLGALGHAWYHPWVTNGLTVSQLLVPKSRSFLNAVPLEFLPMCEKLYYIAPWFGTPSKMRFSQISF